MAFNVTSFCQWFWIIAEIKWKGADSTDKPYNETVADGTEVVASYQYKINNTFSIEPGFSLESSSSSQNYRPYIRGSAKIADGFSASFRYRPWYKRLNGNIGKEGDVDTVQRGHQGNLVLDYKFLEKWQLTTDLEIKKAENHNLYDNDKIDYLYEFKLAYAWDKNWKPYTAIANVSKASDSDERQTRFRVGIQYNF
ncbi:porin [Brenneria alni]|uniref:Porin n=1 Tax=Brenneria alni TaxID=71656 RepID=A0A421DJA2_9GAMM|nr:oligogalacturonate-specific porin KdgM family protein [Brenneria alni]RLM18529.1 porin [Brenneria alni]